jgi:sec-independent protein translocase protein TatB
MFDIGFWELLVVGVVALLVIGPERLPGVARTAGLWLGRFRRMISEVKADIDREVRTQELQSLLNQQNELRSAYDIIEQGKQSLAEVKTAVEQSLTGPAAAPPAEAPGAPAAIPASPVQPASGPDAKEKGPQP